MPGHQHPQPSHVFIPDFDSVYEDFGGVLGLAEGGARPARVSLAVYAILRYRGVAAMAGDDSVKALVDGVVVAPSLPDEAVSHDAAVRYESAFCNVWWRWLSARVSPWRREFEKLAGGLGEAWEDYEGGPGGRGGFCGISALRVESGFDEADVGSLYFTRSFRPGDYLSGILRDIEVSYNDFLSILQRHLSEHYRRVSLASAGVEVARVLPDGASLDAGPGGLQGRLRTAFNRALEALIRAFKDYLAVVALVANGAVEEVGLKGGKKYEDIMSRKAFHDIATRWRLGRLESQLELYGMLEEYYARRARDAGLLVGTAFSMGDLIAGPTYQNISRSYADQAVEAAAVRAALARAYREALKELDAVQVVETPLVPSTEPGSHSLAVYFIVFPLVTGVRLRGARREGVSYDIVATPDGVGVVWASSAPNDYFAFYDYEFNELVGYNGVRERGGLVACAYGDGFTLREYYENGANRCRVCGVPLCGRHRIVVRQRILFIRRLRTYCPEHAPKRVER